jgi:APA family basic amino acid/polyamine antiporter
MTWKHIFAKKDLEMLLAEMAGEHRLHRVLGPVALTSLGVGCIIGAGIFVMTGVAAADYAGPGVMISFAIAALGCALAALCYAEFAAMAPVAGSAYTYAYTTLGEIFAWIIGWDLILEYAMGCATVASAWSGYLNEFLLVFSSKLQIPKQLLSDPFTHVEGLAGRPWFNMPSLLIMAVVTTILVVGIRESARTNAVLVFIKLSVVLFVVAVGWGYIQPDNWHNVPYSMRVLPEEREMPKIVKNYLENEIKDKTDIEENVATNRLDQLHKELRAAYRTQWAGREAERLLSEGRISADAAKKMAAEVIANFKTQLPKTVEDKDIIEKLLPQVGQAAQRKTAESWGILGWLGLNRWLLPIDDATRTPFVPYGLSGLMLGASIVFFAFIGFDSISTHAEEARRPQRDVPIGILVSLLLCTVLYMAVAAVVTGMMPYPDIDIKAPIAVAFRYKAEATHSPVLRASTALVAAGGLAGMTSVLLVLFLSQARILMAMARDGLLPRIFCTVHPRFRTPHIATIVTGIVICLAASLTPIMDLEKMVNVGTLMAFVIVCAAVLILRIQRPDVKRPFTCPVIWLVAPLGIVVNLTLMLFLPLNTWLRLVIWLAIGMVIYFTYSRRHSLLTQHLLREIQTPRSDEDEEPAQPAGG